MFKHILVPTDGSELSNNTVVQAVNFAKESNAKITFFYAQHEFPMITYTEAFVVVPSPDEFAKSTGEEAQRILTNAKNIAEIHHVSCHTDTAVSDHPYKVIIEAAEKNQCDLIFMASHGRKGLMGVLLGSETQKVLTHSHIPVLIYR